MPTCFWKDALDIMSVPGVSDWYASSLTVDANNIEICGVPSKYQLPEIKEVIFNDDATIIVWADDKKTIVHCGEGETFDRYTGFMAAICKRMFGGTTTAKKFMNSIDKQYQAKLKAEKEAEEKAKRIAVMEEAKKKADARRAKEDEVLMEAMVRHYLMEAEAKQRAAEILASRHAENLEVPFDGTEEEEF